MADLKRVYAAVDEESALNALDDFSEKWDKKYPKISESWRRNWPNLSTYFKFPEELRRLIYTTNAIEGFNRQLRKVTKAKSVFPTDDSLFKMLYLAMKNITKKWTGRRMDWSKIYDIFLVLHEFGIYTKFEILPRKNTACSLTFIRHWRRRGSVLPSM